MEQRIYQRQWVWYGAIGASILLLSTLTFILYRFSLHYPFEFDDLSNIVKLFKVRFATFRSLFFANSRWISYWLNALYYRMLPEGYKFDPYLYRVGNLIIHIWSGLAVYFVTLLLQKTHCSHPFMKRVGLLLPLLTAGLFLLHPAQTQTVSYVIQGQLEGMAGAFIFTITCLFLAAMLVQNKIIKSVFCILLFILAILSCGSKEIIIVTPVLLVMVDWFFIACGSWQSLKSRWWLHALIFITIIGIYLYLLKPHYFLTILGCSMELPSNVGNMLTDSRLEKITSGAFFISQFKVILHYLAIFFWPVSMSADYDWKLSRHFLAPDSLVPFLILSAGLFYILYRLRKNSTDIISFCFLWFFIAILPRSSIIPSTELLADYKTYVASFGIYLLQALAIAWLLFWLKDRSWWRGGIVSLYLIALLLLGGISYGAYQRNLVWRSAADFWKDVIKHAPNRARAYNNYGVAVCELGRHEEAISHFKHAIALDSFYADPYNNLSVAYSSLKQFDKAIAAMRKGIQIMPSQPEGYNNLASILINSFEKDEEAEKLLQHAIKLRPHYGKAYFNLGKFYLKHKRQLDAWHAFKAACFNADFDNEVGFTTYGNVSCAVNKFADAVEAYTRALTINPRSLEASLKRIYAVERNGDSKKAQELLERLLKENPPAQLGILTRLGDIWYEYGFLTQALALYERAEALNPSIGVVYKIACTAERMGDLPRARAAVQKLSTSRISPEMQKSIDALKKRLSLN